MLGGEDPLGEALGSSPADRDRGLAMIGPGIRFVADIMHGAEVKRTAGGQRPLMNVQAGEGRSSDGGCDSPVAPGLDEPRRQEAHEAGKADEIDAGPAQRRVEGLIERQAFGVVRVGDDLARDAGPRRMASPAPPLGWR